MRNIGALILSVVLGLLALVLMWIYIGTRESQLLELSAMKDVVVAATDILENTVIDERVVQQIQVPSKYLQPKSIADVRELVGRVTAVPIPKGAQVLGTFLQDSGSSPLAYELPRGRRAVTIAVADITGVGSLVRPGNFVDILGTFEYGRPIGEKGGRIEYAEERTETIMLMQDVQVIAVQQEHRWGRARPRAAGEAEDPGDKQAQRPQEIRNVTLLVGPQQAQQLVLAQHVGQLTLALRSNLDAGQVSNFPRLDPFGLLNVKVPIKPRAMPVWREIRGTSPY